MNRNYLIICLWAILISPSLFGQESGNGTLIIYRDKQQLQGQNFNYPVMINGSEVALIKQGTFYTKSLAPGKYKVSAKTEIESGVIVTILPNDTSYVRCSVNMGFWVGRPDIIQVDKNSARSSLASSVYQDLSLIEHKTFNPKGSFGLIFGLNAGLESFDVFTMEDGKNSSLSTGGSFNIGGQYNLFINKNLEMSIDLRYQGASLSPSLKNATAYFRRGVTNATLFAVAPFKNDLMKLKFGAGLGYHFGCKMEIDGSKVEGGIYKLDYNPALAFRFGSVFETFFNRYSFAMGLFYNNINYKVERATLDSFPFEVINKKTSEPNGSNIELMFGYYLYF
ncbi:MAG: hypothetical protein PHD06_03495 [Bacteroidales bacterium]|mgnify:CR=1 FL=1|nr:hypothetical protein [Bacteroidales bacterium]MDD4384224.1 hypothetical protein [Bacteroidales bacterium]MDY0197505.1 hypothetical protein [Tenuifilaceae bacterium]